MHDMKREQHTHSEQELGACNIQLGVGSTEDIYSYSGRAHLWYGVHVDVSFVQTNENIAEKRV
jgi:uncharacterized RmlC-like cupin family protein